MTARTRALLRLLAVQAAWSYERMLGIGLGHAAEPLLEDLKTRDPARHPEATGRSAEFFNSHPYLAGLALGALCRAERDGAPGEQIQRLRAALCGPLGALGDQLFWAGLVPAFSALALLGVTLGVPGWAIGGGLVLYNVIRLLTSRWALRAGDAAGLQVGSAIHGSWLPRAVAQVAPVAGFSVGLALPLVAAWFLGAAGTRAVVAVLLLAATGVGLAHWGGARVTAVRFTLLAAGLTFLWQGIAP